MANIPDKVLTLMSTNRTKTAKPSTTKDNATINYALFKLHITIYLFGDAAQKTITQIARPSYFNIPFIASQWSSPAPCRPPLLFILEIKSPG
jgi:hypothetical protein